MSLITELIERLRKEADGYMGYRSKRAVRVKHLLREAADTIETLSAKVQAANMERSTAYYNGDWIPVSERLPKRSGEYFVSVIDGSGEDNDYEAVGVAWFAHKKDYDIKESEWRELGIDETVIAWMPLPEPYRAERSGEE